MAAVAAAERPAVASRLVAAVGDAAGTALLALGLAVPILALRIDVDISNQPILRPRWGYVAIAVGLAFAARLAYLLMRPALAAQVTKPEPAPRAAPSARLGQALSLFGLALLALYPVLVLALVGRAGAVKWIDNFGVQILIYVMLGWGLNIVVGLAGLLDLGYVAFYAVGAYSTALLVQNLGFGFWLCLPLAGIFAALWGIMLGFPVLRLRGDYLAIVTLAFGEIIRLVLVNWVPVTNGYAGISGIPRPSFFGLPFNASDEGFAAFFGLEFSPLHRTIFLSNLVQVTQGPRYKPAPSIASDVITLFQGADYSVTVSHKQILIVAVTTVLLAGFWYLVRFTAIGRAQRACEQDRRMAALLGVNVNATISLTFVMGAALAAVAGLLFMIYYGVVHFNDGFVPGVKAFTAAVLGGIGSLPGAVLGGLLIGLIETLWSAYFSIDYKDVATFSILAITLIFLPSGLLGKPEVEKV
jgi:branched-chain amino acid transport system permease protein